MKAVFMTAKPSKNIGYIMKRWPDIQVTEYKYLPGLEPNQVCYQLRKGDKHVIFTVPKDYKFTKSDWVINGRIDDFAKGKL